MYKELCERLKTCKNQTGRHFCVTFSYSSDASQQVGRLLGLDHLAGDDDGRVGTARLRHHLVHPADLHLLRLHRRHVRLRPQDVLGCLQAWLEYF